jgi:hypothetical protein
MNKLFGLIIFSVLHNVVCSDEECDYPLFLVSDYEWDMAQIVTPPSYWGRRMREEQTIHIMTLGGSNTDGEGRGFRWPEYLREQMKVKFPNIATSCLNKGKPLVVYLH